MSGEARDTRNWAAKVDRLHVAAGGEAVGYNIEGRRVAGPQQGFGRLWQRTSIAWIGDRVTPEQLIADWRAHFAEYWPRMARFHGTDGVVPGAVAPLTNGPLATGILVLYADETSFTFMTPEGHMFAGMITFSADRGARGTRARIDILLRMADPVVELAWPLVRPGEDRFWAGTLRNLAAAHGVSAPPITQSTVCIDRRRLWRNWTNVFGNIALRTALHAAGAPLRARRRGAA